MTKRRVISVLAVFAFAAALAAMMAMVMSPLTGFGATKKVRKVTLNKTKLTMKVGDSKKLVAKVTPSGASKKVKWKSSNRAIAVVSAKGIVKAKKAGKVTVTCTSCANSARKAKCVVTVKKKVSCSDNQELKNAEVYLSRTGDALYSYLQDDSVYYKENTAGHYLWIIQKSLGVVRNIEVYKGESIIVGRTYCSGAGYPILTLDGGSDEPQTIKDNLDSGSYDYAGDPAKVLIDWNAWSSSTSKKDLEKTINGKLSDSIFASLETFIDNNSYSGEYGGSRIIIFGKNAKGQMVGKYAGGVNYTSSPTKMKVEVIGINSECAANYGKTFTYSITYEK